MTENGLHLPVWARGSAGIMSINSNGLVMLTDFKLNREASAWWNKYVADGIQYPELNGFRVMEYGVTHEVGDTVYTIQCEDCVNTYRLYLRDTGDFLMSVDKTTGIIDSVTCREDFIGFVADWNAVCSGDSVLGVRDGALCNMTSKQSVVLGSIFDKEVEECW